MKYYFEEMSTFAQITNNTKTCFMMTVHHVDGNNVKSTMIPMENLYTILDEIDNIEEGKILYLWDAVNYQLTAIPSQKIQRVTISFF